MAYFPSQILPKRLVPETIREVDDSPTIYNARDYNTHLREMIAIERFLVGNGLDSAGVGTTGITGMLNALVQEFNNLSQNGTISQTSGVVPSDGTVPLPAGLANTYTSGAVAAGATSILVVSVQGFPTSGYITKFNSVKTSPAGTSFGFKSLCSQEIIQYTSVDTSTNEFLGCTRAVMGSAQDVSGSVVGSTPALIVAGRASIFLAHKGWQTVQPAGGEALVANVWINHDASLNVTNAVYDNAGSPMDETREIIYSLTMSGAFEDIRVLESA